jgi:O-antigen/teichoic acid export membrane protein
MPSRDTNPAESKSFLGKYLLRDIIPIHFASHSSQAAVIPGAYLRSLSPARRATFNTLAIGLVAQGIIAISGVLAARILGPEDRGHLALYTLIAVIFVELGGLGLPTAMTYRIAKDPSQARAIVRALAPTIAGQVVLLVVIQTVLMAALFGNNHRHVVVAAAAVTLALVPSTLAQRYGLGILQGQQRFTWFNILRIASPAFYSAGIVALFLAGWHSLLAVTIGLVAGNVLAGTWALTVALRGLPADQSASRPSVRPMLRFGVKGMLGASNPVETFNLDQAVVGLALSPAALGLYVVGVAFTNLPGFVAKSIGLVAYPQVASQPTAPDVRRTVWRYFWFNLALGLAVIAPLELLSGWLVPLLFGHQFRGAIPITRILLVSAFFLAGRRVLSDGLRGAGFPGLGSVAEISTWFVLVPLLPLFVTLGGTQGVALALVIASGFALLLLMVLAHRRLGGGPDTVAWQPHSSIPISSPQPVGDLVRPKSALDPPSPTGHQ